MTKLIDNRSKQLRIIKAKDGTIQLKKGRIILCEVVFSIHFKELSAIKFNPKIILCGDTLIQIGSLLNQWSRERGDR